MPCHGIDPLPTAALAAPAVAACTADGKTVATFPITLSTEAVLNDTVGKNYTISSQSEGTLIVNNRPPPVAAEATPLAIPSATALPRRRTAP